MGVPDTAWLFNFLNGNWEDSERKREVKATWAVHDGNVGGSAGILIDDFENSRQVVPETDSTPGSSELEVPTALGGWRRLVQTQGDNLIIIDQGDNLGFNTDAGVLFMSDGGKFGGKIRAEWNGANGNGLGGIDLTAGGDHFQLRGVLLDADGDALHFNYLEIRVTDTFGQESIFRRGWDEIEKNTRLLSGLAYFILIARNRWDDYQLSFEDMLSNTSTPWAPWHVIPADHKWVMRALVAHIVNSQIRTLSLRYPPADVAKIKAMREAIKALKSER